MIPFNQPYFTGKEQEYIQQAIQAKVISGNGSFTQRCSQLLENRYQFNKVLLTTSCTDALEMSALLINVKQGDEIIMPSYTFVSTANAFILKGAKIVFADSRADHPGIDEDKIEALITPKTKAIVVVHYAGVACDMDKIKVIAKQHKLFVIEDAAQAIDAYYYNNNNKIALGSIGHLGTFSFHATKNITCGEGGALIVNDNVFSERAAIIHDKGTNRDAFSKGLVNQYEWVDIGSSFLPSEITAAFLLAQLEAIDTIQQQRNKLWDLYFKLLSVCSAKYNFQLPVVPTYAMHNSSIFYFTVASNTIRNALINYLKTENIQATFHYTSLHQSKYFKPQYNGSALPNTIRYSDTLIRLPLYFELKEENIIMITDTIKRFFEKTNG
jgi:dTDP-4-amino-4,6-dideoxygalactose transaminase